MISYAITVCNEAEQLDTLLRKIYTTNISGDNEIVVLTDEDNTTDEVYDILNDYRDHGGMRYFSHKLNKDFATHKNYLNDLCCKEWIFQIDADEYPHEVLLMNLSTILKANEGVEAIWVPRVNTVEGITNEDIARWGWNVSPQGWINWPDAQLRLYRKDKKIRWTKPVHEQLIGFTTWAHLPFEEKFSLYHPKQIDRQRRQNAFYDTI